MNRIIVTIFVFALLLSACGASSAPASPSVETPAVSPTLAPTSSPSPKNDPAPTDLAPISSLVRVTVGKEIIGDVTPEQVQASVEKKGYASGVLNDDGSVTYEMTNAQRDEFANNIAALIDNTIKNKVVGRYDSISDVTHNDDFTEFSVFLNSDILGAGASMSALELYAYGGLYQKCFDRVVDNIHVIYINSAGEIVEEANSENIG
jgi:hypothetical protein